VSTTLVSNVLDVLDGLDVLDVGGGVEAAPLVGISPASVVTERSPVRAIATTKRFMLTVSDLLLTKPYDIDQRLLEHEHDLIKQALIQSDGKVSQAARLVGKSYQGLAKMIQTKHPDLIPLRTPVRRRSRNAHKR
jgi:hypothetical protein